jgi:hypothetical protein
MSRIRLEAENAIFRHQLIVLQRKIRGRVRFTNSDRLFFMALSLVSANVGCPSDHPTRRWHRVGLRRYRALEVPIGGWPAANRCGSAHLDPTDERRQSPVARSTYPRRVPGEPLAAPASTIAGADKPHRIMFCGLQPSQSRRCFFEHGLPHPIDYSAIVNAMILLPRL